MRRLFLFLAVVAVLAAGAAFHRTHAATDLGTFVTICHANGSGSPGVLDGTTTIEEAGSTTTYRSVITYFPGKQTSIPVGSIATHLAHGDSLWYAPLFDSVEQILTTLEDREDYVVDLGFVKITVDYENVNMVPGNADCYWSTSEFTTP